MLRAEALFGCCRCGHPFFQYHHIVPWGQEQHFRAGDMMVLCPNCHDMATRGGLSVEEQRRFKSRPHNVRKGYAAGIVSVPWNVPVLSLGGTLFVNDGTMLAFKGTPVLAASLNEASGLELSLDLEDREGRTIAIVERNEWVSGDASVWDLECGYRWLKIRARKLSDSRSGEPVESGQADLRWTQWPGVRWPAEVGSVVQHDLRGHVFLL